VSLEAEIRQLIEREAKADKATPGPGQPWPGRPDISAPTPSDIKSSLVGLQAAILRLAREVDESRDDPAS
jgi:hypothetical protein